MKKYIILIFIITSVIGYSQSLKSFIDLEAQWSVAKTYPNPNPQNPSFVETRTKIFGFIGDTLVNNILWQKYFSTYDIEFQSEFIFEAYIRAENGYLFAMDSNSIIDTLYNFNIQVGDSIGYDFGFGLEYLEVLNIDSLLINDEYRKRFYFEEPFYPPSELTEIWIEGIGSIHGPLFPINPKLFSSEIPDSINLTCYKIGHTVLWQNPGYESCYITIVLSLEELKIEALKVYPNPATTHITFELPMVTKNTILQIKDIHGQTKEEIPIQKGSSEITWTCCDIKSGVYFYQTEIEEKTHSGKVLIQ